MDKKREIELRVIALQQAVVSRSAMPETAVELVGRANTMFNFMSGKSVD